MRTNIQYAETADQYDRGVLHRPAADPLGMRGLPATRAALDAKLYDLIDALKGAGREGVGGADLAARLGLEGTRALRLLAGYARVHFCVHQVVGIPGEGYCWGDARPEAYARSIDDNTRRARCHFYIAALLKRQGTAMAAAQLVFDFFDANIGKSGPAGGRTADDLAALVAAEGVSLSEFLDAFLQSLGATPEGRKVLSEAGKKHAGLLLSREVLERVERQIADALGELRAGAKPAA